MDASQTSFAAENPADWENDVDPGDVDDALDQLAAQRATGPSSATDNAIARWDGTTGKLLQDSSVILSDAGGMTSLGTLSPSAGVTDLGTTINTWQDLYIDNIVGPTVFNEDSADVDFRIESNGDANNFVSDGGTNRIGIGMLSPNEKLQVTDAIAISNNTEGNTARLTRRTSHDVVTLLGGSEDTTTISIPSGARILAVSMNVNTVVDTTGIGNDLWSAAFITGSTTNIVTDESEVQDTKTDVMIPDEITTAVTQIRFTPKAGNFNSGVIEIVVYYEELTSLADV